MNQRRSSQAKFDRFRESILQELERQGLTRAQVVRDLQISQSSLYMFLNGSAGLGFEKFVALCEYLGMELSSEKADEAYLYRKVSALDRQIKRLETEIQAIKRSEANEEDTIAIPYGDCTVLPVSECIEDPDGVISGI